MARIFSVLALFALALLAANLIFGFMIGDFNGASRELVLARQRLAELERSLAASPSQVKAARDDLASAARRFQPIRQRATFHTLLGVAGSLVTVLVNSITVTYFIGTSRWCREVVDAYSLDQRLADRSDALKRQTFPWALGGILAILIVIALGAAADPGANFQHSAAWVTPHSVGAFIGTALIGWSLAVQVGRIRANYEVIDEIVAQVRRIRAERNLDE